MASLAPSGRVVQGKYEGKEVYVWVENKSLMIHNGEFKKGLFSSPTSCQLYEINSVSIVDYQEMGSLTQSANPEAVLKAGFWFGAVAALATSQIGTQEIYSIAIEYPDGERSLLQLNSFAYKTFKTIAFSIDETKRKTQKQTLPKPAKIYEQESPINQKSTHEVLPTVEKRQIIINENNLQASLKRAFLFLEDEEWETANEYFESILDVDPEYAEAYLGKLMIKNKISQKDDLANQEYSFFQDKLYQRALRFADDKFKNELKAYSSNVFEKNKTEMLEDTEMLEYVYSHAMERMVVADTPQAYKYAQNDFRTIKGFKNADNMAAECELKIAEVTQENYNQAVKLMNDKNFYEAIRFFISVIDYNNSRIMCRICAEEIEKERNVCKAKIEILQTKGIELKKEQTQLENTISILKQNIKEYNEKQKELNTNNKEYTRIKDLTNQLKSELSGLGKFSGRKKKMLQEKIDFNNSELNKISDKISEIKKNDYTDESFRKDQNIINDAEKRIEEIEQIQKDIQISLIAQIQKNESLGPEIAPEVFIGDSVYSFGVVYDSSLFLLWSDYISNDFLQQNKINSIVVGKGISYISEFAFDQCVSLKTVFISEGVIKIGDSAFNGCNGLRKIILPGSVKVVGKYAFRCCENLSDVSFIGSNLKTIGEGAFFQCKSLTSITLPDSVSWIGKDAFSCCEQLSEAHLPQNVTIDANAFKFTKVIL